MSASDLCQWPKGCDQPVSLTDGRDVDLCYYHWKVTKGFVDVAFKPRPTLVSPAMVISREREEMAEILVKLGAPESVVRRALGRIR